MNVENEWESVISVVDKKDRKIEWSGEGESAVKKEVQKPFRKM